MSGARTPAPTNYNPRHNFNENVPSVFKKPGHTKFTSDKKTFMDH